MAKLIYAYDIDGGERRTQGFIAGGTIAEGVPVALSAGKVVTAAADQASGVVGVSVSGAATNEALEVITNRRAVFKMETTGTVKTSLTAADIGTSFEYDPTTNKLDLDETEDGWLTVVDFNDKYVWVVIEDIVRGL